MVFNKIIELKETIVLQSNRIEKMLQNCLKGVIAKDSLVIDKVVNKHEKKINKNEIKIDEVITAILALYHPEAKDLRYVLMMARMNYDLERMGDHCVEIAESAFFLLDKPEVKPLIDIPRMFESTINMLQETVTAFINEDVVLSMAIHQKDNEIENIANQVFRELLTYMISDPKKIENAFHLITISTNLVKISELITNIAEATIYIVEGKVVKHTKEKSEKTFDVKIAAEPEDGQ
ncbi:MAG: phosphate transport system regulatory protein PhoU [Spirochaetes bacterium GWF1_31_7]|nr:MAG: phosphate transport system regulatory protein PhoU [Spirochaetes bacterium GWE1_32_154]OHD51884.1 MAG: phosphate transport system regulatory protein PhoU [Spirochaetes bacterium GWE2_31_10]OHD52991.1 MAG: phosphate transport system regulatory protein PhoU [Spirochaetes bacterium GWF1_31_7]OHD78869.1 MAG: phosphate transport system regulatory protein PhoU [Spirochaetes bacterium RIFOXYB1_FULL_32_8]